MKKYAKVLTLVCFLIGLICSTSIMTSCSSSKRSSSKGIMFERKRPNSKVIMKNYKVRGNNKSNSSTYKTY